MTDATLRLEISRTGDAALVLCHGKLVYGATDVLSSQVRPLIPQCKRIVLDLTDLTVMDSIGLGALVRLYAAARGAGCELELINLRQRIRELLALTNLLSVFSVVGEHGIKL